MQPASLPATNPYPLPDPAQVFQSQTATGAFRLLNKLLADLMVDSAHEAPFSSRKSPEHAFGRFGADGLHASALAVAPLPDADHAIAPVVVSIRIGGNVYKSEINAQDVLHSHRLRLRHFTGHMQVEAALLQAQELMIGLIVAYGL